MLFQFGNILLRPLEKKDLELLHRWENDAEVMMYSRSKPLSFLSMAQLENQFEEWLKEDKHQHFIVELADTNEPIGSARLELRDWGGVRSGHIGTYIAKKELWGKGIGRQITVALLEMAFTQLNMERCEAGSVEYNTRAHRALMACGFKKSGTNRKITYVNGRKWDQFYFDLLREEYLNVRMELLKKTLGNKLEQYLKTNRTS